MGLAQRGEPSDAVEAASGTYQLSLCVAAELVAIQVRRRDRTKFFESMTSFRLTPQQIDHRFDYAVWADAHDIATASHLELLAANPRRWKIILARLLNDTEESLKSARSMRGLEREQVIDDLESERADLAAAWFRLTGERDEPEPEPPVEQGPQPGPLQLHLSWEAGRIVAWAGGPHREPVPADQVGLMLEAIGAPSTGWTKRSKVSLPDGANTEALEIPVGKALGWLASLWNSTDDISASALWLSQVAAWAVQMTASGSMVPLLRQRNRRRRSAEHPNSSTYSVRWTPALIDPQRMNQLADSAPGAVSATDPSLKGRDVVRSALTGMIDAICRDAAGRVTSAAMPPSISTAQDVAEAYLASLNGSPFEAPNRPGNEMVGQIDRWAKPVTASSPGKLVVKLDAPDSGDAWYLSVLAFDLDDHLVPVEVALVTAGGSRREIEDQLLRLERLLPALLRPGGTRRGEVILSQSEAWELMSQTGPTLSAAGYDVRVPQLSKRKAAPSLRVYTESTETVVGANQLANVSWSAVFGDVELTAAEIAALAKQARPLVRSGGAWVAVDHADLHAAAAALEERSRRTQMTGAEVLRHALGLEGTPLAGGISLAGDSWAAGLLEASEKISQDPVATPKGFKGELRSYQREALSWLGFLDDVGLGGCLALDMGLGKTPTMLAHLWNTAGRGPALVIAPPAVVGNWAAEAHKFTPKMNVVIHHGASRSEGQRLVRTIEKADVVITTYGTAVRDIDELETVQWDRVVLDEAQAIKNPANDTAQQLRRLNARVRVALTGTPIENGLGDLWAILDFTNPGLVGTRSTFIAHLSQGSDRSKVEAEDAMRALNGILVFRRTKAEPAISKELPDRIDELDHCAMTAEQIGLYQAVIDKLLLNTESGAEQQKGAVLAAITALKQICNHPSAYQHDDAPLAGRSGKLSRLEEICEAVFVAEEKILIFTHFASWGVQLADYLTEKFSMPISCYHGGLSRGVRDDMISQFQSRPGPGALVLSLKAGGTGLNLTAASHVVLYDRWWNPAVEDQARDRAWRIGQTKTVIAHRLVCPGTVDERVEEVVAGKRQIAELVLPKSSSLADLDASQLRIALGMRPDEMLTEDMLNEQEEIVAS